MVSVSYSRCTLWGGFKACFSRVELRTSIGGLSIVIGVGNSLPESSMYTSRKYYGVSAVSAGDAQFFSVTGFPFVRSIFRPLLNTIRQIYVIVHRSPHGNAPWCKDVVKKA